MTDDRSRDERAPYRSSEAGIAREPWYERLLHLFALKPKESLRDDIEDALAETDDNGDVSPKERTMIKNVLELHRVRIDDLMVPRSEIVAVAADTDADAFVYHVTDEELLALAADTGGQRWAAAHLRVHADLLVFSQAHAPDQTRRTPHGGGRRG